MKDMRGKKQEKRRGDGGKAGWTAGKQLPFFWGNRMYSLLVLYKGLKTRSPSHSDMTRVYKDASSKAMGRW